MLINKLNLKIKIFIYPLLFKIEKNKITDKKFYQ